MNYKLFFILFLFSCSSNYTPKPRAFVKIHLPEKEFQKADFFLFSLNFEHPIYSELEIGEKANFINIIFEDFSAILHLTYVNLDDNLYAHIEESRSLAYKHNLQANSISEQVYLNTEKSVFGMLYNYSGMTATSTQFYLTDSVTHFLRGSLYFNTEINDSIKPLNDFLKKDVVSLIESVQW